MTRLAAVRHTTYHLPETKLTTEQLAALFPEWPVAKIDSKTGIQTRRIAAPGECASDLAFSAATKLFASGIVSPADIDALLFCSQSPDYFLPATACTLQNRLGLSTDCFALDINQGCSGFVYGLGLAKSLIESSQATNVLLLNADTYSRYLHPEDRSVRTIFGDAAAATLISSVEGGQERHPLLGPFVYGTDGNGAANLILPGGGFRIPGPAQEPIPEHSTDGVLRTAHHLYMNGAAIFEFTMAAVPELVADLLTAAKLKLNEVDLFVFHQANRYMLTSLQKAIGIEEERFVIAMQDSGNTVSATIPIALAHALADGRLRPGNSVMLIGFGVGYSWAGAMMRWG